MVGRQIGAIPPFLKLGGIKQPVARVLDGGAYVLLAGVDLEEAEGAEAGCDASAFRRYKDWRRSKARHKPSFSFCGAPASLPLMKLNVVLSPVVKFWSTLRLSMGPCD